MLVICFHSAELHAIEIIAHRANACGATENSLEAVRLASAAGVGALELDVRVSRDGVVYLYHDDDINDKPLAHLDYAEIKQRSRVDEVPTLQSVLATKGFEGFYILDLKQVATGQVFELTSAVTQAGLDAKRIVFQSEKLELLGTIHEILPDNRYYLLERLERRFPYVFAPKPNKVIMKTSARFIEGVSLKGRSFLNAAYVHTLKKTGLRVFVWTINSESRAIHYRKSGVDGIITDTPLTFSALFNSADDKLRTCPRT